MSYPKPTVKITQVSRSLPCTEFSTEDNPNRFTHHIALFLLRCFSGVHRNHLLTQEQADGLCPHSSAASGSSLSCCKEACSSPQRKSSPRGWWLPPGLCPAQCPPRLPYRNPNLIAARRGGQQVAHPLALRQPHHILPPLRRCHEAGPWAGDRELGKLTDCRFTANVYYWTINHER